MRKYFTILFMLLCTIILLSGVSYAQQTNKVVKEHIHTLIVDQTGKPVSGALITAEDGAIETKSNRNGMFSIQVPTNSKLYFEAKGYRSRIIPVDSLSNSKKITLHKMPFQMSSSDAVDLPFGTLKKRRVLGDVTTINPSQILNYDNITNLYGVFSGRVPGLYGSSNVRGLGGALLVVDGIPRDNLPMTPQEIDKITVLKDINSQILYGDQAGNGVILVTTKHGQAYHKDFNVTLLTGIENPIAYPKYLNAAQYMKMYNEALSNDGLSAKYDSTAIANTQNHTNPVLYPDKSYYNSTYLRNYSSYSNIITQASGGNSHGQYYLDVGWNHNNSLLKLGEGGKEQTDHINVRGNVDYQITPKMTFTMGAMAMFNIFHTYGSSNDFWQSTTQLHPNDFPNLIPAKDIADSTIIKSANLIDGKYLLGGTNQFRNNIYGDLTETGYSNQLNRWMQMNTGLKVNLDFITKGLSANGYISFDTRNFFNNYQLNTYAVYQPNLISTPNGDSLAVTKYGTDNITGAQDINNVTFEKNLGFYGTLDYNRTFDDVHNLSATAVAYSRQVYLQNQLQPEKFLHYGLRANYMYKNKYIVEFDGAVVGSSALYGSNRYAFSPSVSLGWIASEEPFLKSSNVIDFLKIKAGYGILNTDQGVPGDYLYETTYQQGGNFVYDETSGNENRILTYNTIGNTSLSWEQRKELNLGLESLFLKNLLEVNANFYISTFSGIYNQLTNTYPAFLGGIIPEQNYGVNRDTGVELGLTFNNHIGPVTYSLGANVMYDKPLAVKVDEPQYKFGYQYHQGKPYDAMFGYVAEGLFQSQKEIDNSPKQTLGPVQPGDIKYKDLNGDGIIDSRDQKMIGNSKPRETYGIHLLLQYKNLELFALGYGQYGADTYFNSSYYWVYGDEKYSNVVLNRWTPQTAATATYPRLSSTNNPNDFVNSTFWLHKDNWFKLQTVQLTYSFPEHTILKTPLKSVRVYLRGSNLMTISGIRNYLILNVGRAPQTRNFEFGIITSF